uniref:SCP domain-containing protein n=1 Tax=Oryza brachyantha TaxID=4533 RepID=J3MIB5_ORYBR
MEKGAAFAAVAMATAVLAMTTTARRRSSCSSTTTPGRAAVGVSTAVSWNEALAATKALEHARYCQKKHMSYWVLWRGATGGTTGIAADAMSYWVGEKQYYDHGSNTCSAPAGIYGCLHYTHQSLTRTTYVGCARVACNTGGISTLLACNYYPRGNMDGEIEPLLIKLLLATYYS